MLLQREGEELLLKVPKELRQLLKERLELGTEIMAHGRHEEEARSGDQLFVVTRVEVVGQEGQPPAGGSLVEPIHVCAKKNCWKSGGRELCAALHEALREHGLDGMVAVEETSCLDRCKSAPNADWGRHEYSRCRPREAKWIVEQIAGEIR